MLNKPRPTQQDSIVEQTVIDIPPLWRWMSRGSSEWWRIAELWGAPGEGDRFFIVPTQVSPQISNANDGSRGDRMQLILSEEASGSEDRTCDVINEAMKKTKDNIRNKSPIAKLTQSVCCRILDCLSRDSQIAFCMTSKWAACMGMKCGVMLPDDEFSWKGLAKLMPGWLGPYLVCENCGKGIRKSQIGYQHRPWMRYERGGWCCERCWESED